MLDNFSWSTSLVSLNEYIICLFSKFIDILCRQHTRPYTNTRTHPVACRLWLQLFTLIFTSCCCCHSSHDILNNIGLVLSVCVFFVYIRVEYYPSAAAADTNLTLQERREIVFYITLLWQRIVFRPQRIIYLQKRTRRICI